jgi:N-acetylglutamate synthase-like GNAT family acetyltransferase
MKSFQIRSLNEKDRTWIAELVKEWWEGPLIVTHGRKHYPDKYPGFIAEVKGKRAGLVTYNIIKKECEIVTMNSLVEKIGIGSALIDAVKDAAKKAGCQRLWLITSNDNTYALKFYQKYGFELVAVHRNAITKLRQTKPDIPLTGNDGIPIKDEIELEILL